MIRQPLLTFPVRMTVMRGAATAGASAPLLLVSSFPPTPPVLSALAPLGTVSVVLAPNAIHCLWGAAMRDACPGSVLAGPPSAAGRFPGRAWDKVVSCREDFEGLMDEHMGGQGAGLRAWTTGAGSGWLEEILLLHLPSRTLVVTDLGFNFNPKADRETPLPGGVLGALMRHVYLPLAGGYRGCCPTKPFVFLIEDADLLFKVLSEVMASDFDQVIPSHGDIIRAPHGKAAFGAGTFSFVGEIAAARRRRLERCGKAGLWPPIRGGGATAAAAAAAVLVAAAALAGAAVWWCGRDGNAPQRVAVSRGSG